MMVGFALALGFGLTTGPPDGPLLQTLHSAHVCAEAAAAQALARGAREDVKRFAAAVQEGHRSADQAVQGIAAKLGLTLVPPAAEDASNEEASDLDTLAGPALDKAFLRMEIASHARVVSDIEAARSTVSDKLVKKLCSRELRALQALEEKARRLEEKL